MMTSGLVLTLSADPGLARQAQDALRSRGELTLGAAERRWLPVAVEVSDARAGRELHEWLATLPGIEFVDVVQVNFEYEIPGELRGGR
jgi:hypothetical protein